MTPHEKKELSAKVLSCIDSMDRRAALELFQVNTSAQIAEKVFDILDIVRAGIKTIIEAEWESKTFAQDFKEHFGHEWNDNDEWPCRNALYYCKDCDKIRTGVCEECWNEKMTEATDE